MMAISANEKNIKNILAFTDEIVQRFPGRITGSEPTQKAGARIKEVLSSFCDRTLSEKFINRPDGFLRFIKYVSVFYLAGALILFMRPELVHVTTLLLILSAAMFLSQFVLYLGWFDFLAPEKKGKNIYGIIEPSGEVKQQIIISGHYDAPYVFTWLSRARSLLYVPVIVSGVIVIIASLAGTMALSIMSLTGNAAPGFAPAVQWFMIGGIPLIAPLFWFTTGRISPGAGDNMVAVAIATEAGKIFREAGKKVRPLKHTRLVIMAFDAEEAGLKGAHAWCRSHREELLSLKTFNLNIDSIYNLRHLAFFTRDINSIVPLSKKMALQCRDIAGSLGYKAIALPLPVGGGATDAGEFGRIGVEATNIIAMDLNAIRKDLAYHTERDTVETIEPEAVKAVLDISLQYIMQKDEEISIKN